VGIYLADQTLVFFQGMLVGAVLALLFDAFRISRIALPTPVWAVFVEDVVFFLVCAVVTFSLMLSVLDGQVRFFVLVGQGLGAALYSLTLGQLVMAVSKTIISIIKRILWFLFRWILLPVWKLFYHIVAFCLRPFYFIAGFAKKTMQRWKFRLKIRRLLVYNHFKDCLRAKRRNPEDPTEDETEG